VDVRFEKDRSITPLESALLIWRLMEREGEIKQNQFFEELKLLLQVQSVAVCMEHGQYHIATEILERQFEEDEQNLRMKLSMIINKRDPYHLFLQNFSYSHMLQKVKSFIDLILSKDPPFFLQKAAARVSKIKIAQGMVLEPSDSGESLERTQVKSIFTSNTSEGKDPELESCLFLFHYENNPREEIQAFSEQEIPQRGKEERGIERNKLTKESGILKGQSEMGEIHTRKLFIDAATTQWHGRKIIHTVFLSGRSTIAGIPSKENDSSMSDSFLDRKLCESTIKKLKRWLWEEDLQLKTGVRKYGIGNWSKILQHYQFNNRTSVMLKDRWRTLRKLKIVSSDLSD
uniref:Telomeric repeat binding factor 1 n=1 Tax=Latimeria chalumnae TaxID=7897 RepID=H3ABF2_LATCH